MAHFTQESSEYIANGHYRIHGIDFMSVWAFKKHHNIVPNTNAVNGQHGIELSSGGFEMHSSTPDFGGYDKVYLYPKSALERFFGI